MYCDGWNYTSTINLNWNTVAVYSTSSEATNNVDTTNGNPIGYVRIPHSITHDLHYNNEILLGPPDDTGDNDEKLWLTNYSQYSGGRVSFKAFVAGKTSNNGAGTGCFSKGTKITMYNYEYKNIEDIKIGDIVLSYNTLFKTYEKSNVVTVKSYNNCLVYNILLENG